MDDIEAGMEGGSPSTPVPTQHARQIDRDLLQIVKTGHWYITRIGGAISLIVIAVITIFIPIFIKYAGDFGKLVERVDAVKLKLDKTKETTDGFVKEQRSCVKKDDLKKSVEELQKRIIQNLNDEIRKISQILQAKKASDFLYEFDSYRDKLWEEIDRLEKNHIIEISSTRFRGETDQVVFCSSHTKNLSKVIFIQIQRKGGQRYQESLEKLEVNLLEIKIIIDNQAKLEREKQPLVGWGHLKRKFISLVAQYGALLDFLK